MFNYTQLLLTTDQIHLNRLGLCVLFKYTSPDFYSEGRGKHYSCLITSLIVLVWLGI